MRREDHDSRWMEIADRISTGEEIDLNAILRRREKVDMRVLAGGKARLPARLVAIKLKKEVANARRRKARGNRDRRTNPGKRALELLGWEAEYKDVRAAIETAWNWMNGPRGGKRTHAPVRQILKVVRRQAAKLSDQLCTTQIGQLLGV